MSALQAFVKNPRVDAKTNQPSSHGQTRVVAGQLEYLNPMTSTFVRAVRLQDIRQQIIQQSLLQGNGQGYRYPKSHGNKNGHNPTDYTSFLPRDQSYGEDRGHRNPILFQIEPSNAGRKPTNYVVDNGYVVLDPFDHGIRDFGNDMPLCLSSRLDGWDIETYLRRNSEISYYDIIARMPNGYFGGKSGENWHAGPPRVGTISMRATRFRLKAGCLAWTEKGDSAAKNEKMRSFMPQACKDVNSSVGFRDLTKQEQKDCETAKGKRANKGRKAKRRAAAPQEEDTEDDTVEEINHDTQPQPIGENSLTNVDTGSMQYGGSSGSSLTRKPKKRARRSLSEPIDSEDDAPKPIAKRQRVGVDDFEDVESGCPPGKRGKQAIRRPYHHTESELRSSRQNAESAMAFGAAIAQSVQNAPPNPVPEKYGRELSLDTPSQSVVDNTNVLSRRQMPDYLNVDRPSNVEDDLYDYSGSGNTEYNGTPSTTEWESINESATNHSMSSATADSGLVQGSTASSTTTACPIISTLDPDSPEFVQESFQRIGQGDYRYYDPSLPGFPGNAAEHIQNALALTVVDYIQKSGDLPPGELLQNHQHESYASQWLRLFQKFRECVGDQMIPRLFKLPAWDGGFHSWGEVLNGEGVELWTLAFGDEP